MKIRMIEDFKKNLKKKEIRKRLFNLLKEYEKLNKANWDLIGKYNSFTNFSDNGYFLEFTQIKESLKNVETEYNTIIHEIATDEKIAVLEKPYWNKRFDIGFIYDVTKNI